MQLDIISLFAAECSKALAKPIMEKLTRERGVANLSDQQREMLRAAADGDGDFQVLTGETISGAVIHTRRKRFGDAESAPTCVRACEDFERLCALGLVRHESRILFRLTSRGFDAATYS